MIRHNDCQFVWTEDFIFPKELREPLVAQLGGFM
jgi:hypothetical protein